MGLFTYADRVSLLYSTYVHSTYTGSDIIESAQFFINKSKMAVILLLLLFILCGYLSVVFSDDATNIGTY